VNLEKKKDFLIRPGTRAEFGLAVQLAWWSGLPGLASTEAQGWLHSTGQRGLV
jgi:hypothetical protein